MLYYEQGRKAGETMLKLIICDDDHFTLRLAGDLVKKAIAESKADARIVCLAASGSELLNFIKNTQDTYLYFLDFDLGRAELNGIDLVRRIYQTDPGGKIIFVTSHTDKGMEILRSGIRAYGFIAKHPESSRMIAEYARYLKMAAPSQTETAALPFMELPIGIEETVRIPVTEIAYVDSVKTTAHSICYHTFDGSEITVRDTMEHAQEQLGADFVRCHRSVLVNRLHVVSMKNGTLKLSNGTSVFCAMGKRKEILEKCFPKEDSCRD